MANRIAIGALGLLGLLLNVWLTWNMLLPSATFQTIAEGATAGRNDFLSFYAGAALSTTPDLYNPEKVSQLQLRSAGRTGDSQMFMRLPCYALFLKPLSFFPYRIAYLIWEFLSAAALLAAVVLWPDAGTSAKWLIPCWFLPIFIGFFNGQDDTLVLFWIALAARLLQRRWQFAAGVALAMGASKYHLIAFTPIVILAQKRWRMAAGLAGGGCLLIAISFLAAGVRWPWDYLALLRNPRWAQELTNVPSFWANFQRLPLGAYFEIAAATLLAFIVYRISRNDDSFQRPIALSIASCTLIALHSWLADCTLLLPALILTTKRDPRYALFPALVLMTPLPWLLLQFPAPLPTVTRILLLYFVLAGLAVSEQVATTQRTGRGSRIFK